MWNTTRTGWLMALANSEDSAWGYAPEFYKSIREEKPHNGLRIVESEVWGKHRYKDHAPAVGDGLAFYHSTKARFARPDPYQRRPRISLIGEPLAKPHLRVLFISQREAKLGGAGGHFWHDEVSTPTS